MDTKTFLGITPAAVQPIPQLTANAEPKSTGPTRWTMGVNNDVITPGGFLFGGAGIAAAAVALESAAGRPLVWATSQFLSYARPPAELQIDVELLVIGHQVTQARAMARDITTGVDILTVNAALGTREVPVEGVWEKMPSVAGPLECSRRDDPPHLIANTIFERFDLRLATARPYAELTGKPGDGTSAMWVHVPEGLDNSAPTVAMLGDYVPFGFGQAFGRLIGGNSLDNTIRIIRPVPTEWILLDVRVHAVHNGFGHGYVNLWAEDGTLCAIASQSAIVRVWSESNRKAEE